MIEIIKKCVYTCQGKSQLNYRRINYFLDTYTLKTWDFLSSIIQKLHHSSIPGHIKNSHPCQNFKLVTAICSSSVPRTLLITNYYSSLKLAASEDDFIGRYKISVFYDSKISRLPWMLLIFYNISFIKRGKLFTFLCIIEKENEDYFYFKRDYFFSV